MARSSGLQTAITRTMKAAFSYIRNKALRFVWASEARPMMPQTIPASTSCPADEFLTPTLGPSSSYHDNGSPADEMHSVDSKTRSALWTPIFQLDFHLSNLCYDVKEPLAGNAFHSGAEHAMGTLKTHVSVGCWSKIDTCCREDLVAVELLKLLCWTLIARKPSIRGLEC